MSPIAFHDFKRYSPIQAIIAHTLRLALVVFFTVTPLYAGDQDKGDSLRKSISALASARQTALHELKTKTMSASEVADYKDFVVYLNTRIVNYCTELSEQGGALALEGLPCPTAAMVVGSESPASDEKIYYAIGAELGETRTQAEKTAELDGDFLASLSEFDDSLLKEEEKLAARVPSQRESGTSSRSGPSGTTGSANETGAGDSGESGSSEEQKEGATSESGRESQSGALSGTQSRSGSGDPNLDHAKYGAPGGKLPPPEDDDIVARQLREAAEKEPDPELKKKLWEEYWKYKGRN